MSRRRLQVRLLVVVAASAALLAVSPPVAGDEPTPTNIERAKELDHQASVFVKAHRFREAAAAYREAYRLALRPIFHFLMGEAYRGDGSPMEALPCYELFLSELESAERLSENERRALAVARQVISELHAQQPQASAPDPTATTPPEGDGRSFTLAPPLDLRLRRPMVMTPAIEQLPERAAAPHVSRTRHNLSIAGSILLASGVGAVAGGGWMASQLDGRAQRLEQDVATAGQWAPDFDRRLDDGHNMQTGSAVLIGIGIPMAIVGAILLGVGAAR